MTGTHVWSDYDELIDLSRFSLLAFDISRNRSGLRFNLRLNPSFGCRVRSFADFVHWQRRRPGGRLLCTREVMKISFFFFSSAFNMSPKADVTGMRTCYSFTTPHSPVLAKSSRNLKYGKRVAYISSSMGILYVFDRYYNASAIFRSLQTIWTVCASIVSVPLPYWWHRSVVCNNNVRL